MGDYLLSKDKQKEEIMKNKGGMQGMNFGNFGYQTPHPGNPYGMWFNLFNLILIWQFLKWTQSWT